MTCLLSALDTALPLFSPLLVNSCFHRIRPIEHHTPRITSWQDDLQLLPMWSEPFVQFFFVLDQYLSFSRLVLDRED